jgi:hypothetical protein
MPLAARDELLSASSGPELVEGGRVEGRRPFPDLSTGETAAPDLSGECGAPLLVSGTQISRRKDPAFQRERLGAEEKAL